MVKMTSILMLFDALLGCWTHQNTQWTLKKVEYLQFAAPRKEKEAKAKFSNAVGKLQGPKLQRTHLYNLKTRQR